MPANALEPSQSPCRHWPLVASVAAVAGSSLLGCGPGGDEPFRITSVSFDGESRVVLTFSEPIVNAVGIDPNDFRISASNTFRVTYTDPYDGTTYTEQGSYYSDIRAFVGDYTRFRMLSVSLGTSDNQLVLEGESGFRTIVCNQLAYYESLIEMYLDYAGPDGVFELGMFLHYAAGDIPVQSESGETIADIGRDWVLSNELYLEVGTFGFPNLSPRLQLPCP